jgi:4-hydroxy-tetrahydrodipicolinate reductase
MEKINLMINGLPGKMAREVARLTLANENFSLLDCSLTGPEFQVGQIISINGSSGDGFPIILFPPAYRDTTLAEIKESRNPVICIDFTHPDAVVENARFYCENGLPFVMGTTGGDREMLEQIVRNSEVPAVIAPNMAKQIVALQAMMKYAKEKFPDLFLGWDLQIRESHQSGKVDTSGTAKAMLKYFKEMGANNTMIHLERDPHLQRSLWGIPEEHLGGHGWHTYILTSPDPQKTMKLEFVHNINGRHSYATGALDAALYVAEKFRRGEKGPFTMIDVLEGN